MHIIATCLITECFAVVLVHDVILASVSHPTATIAMRSTASAALDALDGDPGFLTRTCDCRNTSSNKKTQKGQKAALGYSEDVDGASSQTRGS